MLANPTFVDSMRSDFSQWIDSNAVVVDPDPHYRSLKLIDSATFATSSYPREWLVRDILVRGQPAVLAGPVKSLKTSMMLDLAISLGSGREFLDHFSTPTQRRVAVFSGESGEASLQNAARRICESKEVELAESQVFWSFRLPSLSRPKHLKQLRQLLESEAIELAVLDPLYLCLLDGNKADAAQNLFAMGPLLQRVSDACLEAGATPLLLHHTRKGTRSAKGLMGLEDMAFAGIQEWARQWILVGRRIKYFPGTGAHHLCLNVGGSAGFSGSYNVDVDEGMTGNNFGMHRWQVRVELATAESRTFPDRQRDSKSIIMEALANHPEGATLTGLRKSPDARSITKRQLSSLVDEGLVERCNVIKPAGSSGQRAYRGYRLRATTVVTPDDEQS